MLAACDDGRLYADRLIIPEEGRVVKLTATLSGLDTWTDGYSIVLAGFEAGSDYAVIAKSVQAAEDGTVDLTMSGVPAEVTTLEVCVVNRIRKRVATYHALDCSTLDEDTLRIDAGTQDVGMFATIQRDIFDRTCTGCHGLPRPGALARPQSRCQSPDAGEPAFHRVRGADARLARRCCSERALHYPHHRRERGLGHGPSDAVHPERRAVLLDRGLD